jgi:membrane-anchored protein YejM (alkaline phosphatase superfamily)
MYSELELILQNIDASEVIITSDHGNYLGERGRWGHPFSHTHEAVRNVPWWKTSGTNTGNYQPKEYDRSNQTVSKVESLKALGYL